MENINSVPLQLFRRDGQRELTLFDEATLNRIFNVSEFDAAVANDAATKLAQDVGLGANFWGDDNMITEE